MRSRGLRTGTVLGNASSRPGSSLRAGVLSVSIAVSATAVTSGLIWYDPSATVAALSSGPVSGVAPALLTVAFG